MMNNWQNYISTNPQIMLGKPVITGTCIPVDLILEKLALGETQPQLLLAYPHLTKEAIQACLLFASEAIKNEIVHAI
jgi:uncharacterized protein (DUF433 family)